MGSGPIGLQLARRTHICRGRTEHKKRVRFSLPSLCMLCLVSMFKYTYTITLIFFYSIFSLFACGKSNALTRIAINNTMYTPSSAQHVTTTLKASFQGHHWCMWCSVQVTGGRRKGKNDKVLGVKSWVVGAFSKPLSNATPHLECLRHII